MWSRAVTRFLPRKPRDPRNVNAHRRPTAAILCELGPSDCRGTKPLPNEYVPASRPPPIAIGPATVCFENLPSCTPRSSADQARGAAIAIPIILAGCPRTPLQSHREENRAEEQRPLCEEGKLAPREESAGSGRSVRIQSARVEVIVPHHAGQVETGSRRNPARTARGIRKQARGSDARAQSPKRYRPSP